MCGILRQTSEYEVIEGGHGAGATLEEKSAMTAREFTYFARQLSLP